MQQKSKKPLSLSKAYNALSHQPARRFELRENFRGIAGHYKIPDGLTAWQYETRMERRIDRFIAKEYPRGRGSWGMMGTIDPPAFLQESWDALVRLNPALECIVFRTKRADELYTAHIGVTSGFNIDDINFFLEKEASGQPSIAFQAYCIPGHGERLQRINAALYPETMGWVASPQTAEKIEERLVRRKLIARRDTHAVSSPEEREAYARYYFGGGP